MKEKKTMRRLWCFSDWQREQAVAWLSDLAEQGWLLDSIGFRFAKFIRHEPIPMKYFCTSRKAIGTYDEEQEYKKKVVQAGWKFVDETFNLLFFCAEEGTATLPEGEPLREIKNAKMDLVKDIAWLTVMLALIAGYFLFYFLNPWMFVDYLLKNNFGHLIILFAFAETICISIRSIGRHISTLAQAKGDEQKRQEQPYERIIMVKRAIYWINIAIFLLAVPINIAFAIINYKNESLLPENVVILRLPDITYEQADMETVSRGDSSILYTTHGLLYPDQVTIFDVSDREYTDKKGYTARDSLQCEIYRALTPWLAKILGKQLSQKYYVFNEYDQYVPMPESKDTMGLDKLWLCDGTKNPGMHSLVAVKGCFVYYIDSYSVENCTEIIEDLMSKISQEGLLAS